MHQLEGMAVIIQEYSEDQHPNPPEGINVVGDFRGGQIIPNMVAAHWKYVGIAFIVLSLTLFVIFIIVLISMVPRNS